MTDPTHGQNTGGGATGASEPYGADPFSAPAQPRFAAQRPLLGDAHSPASPYTVTSAPRPARALPMDDEEPPTSPVSAPKAPILPPAPFVAAPIEPPAPFVPPAPVVEPAPIPVPVRVPDPAPSVAAAAVAPVPRLPVEDDDYEPPLVRRPYALATPAFPPGPPSYAPPSERGAGQPKPPAAPSFTPPAQPSPAPFHAYSSPVPPPAALPQPETPHPYSAPSEEDGPLVTARPYARPGSTAYAPVIAPVPNPAPAYALVDPNVSFGGPDSTVGAPAVPSVPPGFGAARPRTENVGRGLLFALGAVIGGCVLAAIVYHLGYVASIIALAMGGAGIFLYAKGAGSPPRKGAVALVVLLMAGILLAWVSSVGTELYFYYVDQTGSSNGALLFAVQGALSLDLFKAMLKDFLIFVGFGALGIFGVARQLLLPRKRK